MDLHQTTLLVMRHAESLEDVDKMAYERIADEDMPLTEKGEEQAVLFGLSLAKALGQRSHLRLYLSPSKRVLKTAVLTISQLPYSIRSELITEPLIRKQDWGNVTVSNRKEVEQERYRAGVLRYQFPGGENGADMLARFECFVNKHREDVLSCGNRLTIAITHGFEMRVLLKTFLNWPEEYFESLAHPHHCEMKRLSMRDGRLVLLDEMRTHDLSGDPHFVRRQS